MSSLNSGLRRTSPESLTAQQFARQYQDPETKLVARTAALKIAKLAAAAMGLKSSKIALIDQLFACSKPADWQNVGVAPIVWPSNARLAARMGVGISTMKHHLNGLVRAGLIAYSDGPTYQRRGRRDEQGNIIEGYGIDLSPIAVRFAELTELVEAADYAAREWKRHSYRRTVLRKEIQSLISSAVEQSLPGSWSHAQARLDRIREKRPDDLEELIDQVAALQAMQSELEDAYEQVIQDVNFNIAVPKFRPLQTTAAPSNSESSRSENRVALAHDKISPMTASGSLAFENKPAETAKAVQIQDSPHQVMEEDLQYLSLPLVRDACPKLSDVSPGIFDSWSSLRESGHNLCVASGINPQVWQEARNTLGSDLAVAAVAVTVQKADLGLVEKPGAYLRTLVKRGRAGELHISRSLFAMAKGQNSHAADDDDQDTPAIAAFPSSGSISFGSWGDVVRKHAPKPTPDVDIVADAFRRWTTDRGIDLTSPNIERVLISFCRKWRMN